jgi:putative sterol carrier protein
VERASQLKKVRAHACSLHQSEPNIQNNGVFEFRVKNDAGNEACWTIDLKKTGTVKKGEAKSHGLKADVSILLADEVFVDLAEGKLNGQKAFMTGKLKTKGNMMLATKLDGLLKVMSNVPIAGFLSANG